MMKLSFGLCVATLGGSLAFIGAACGDDPAEEQAEALEEACNDFCDTVYGADCPTPGGISAEQCRQVCPALEQQLQGLCVTEYTDAFECLAAGGVTCSENGPIPNATCLEENQALMECSATANCERWCNATADAGCAPGGTAGSCKQSCEAFRAELGTCASQYDFYLQCSTSFSITCEDGRPTSEACDEDLTEVGGCLADMGETCKGYCYSSEIVGCTDRASCETGCNATRDANPACGSAWDSWLECVSDDFDLTCSGTELVSSSCDYLRDEHDTCVMGM